MVEAVSSSNQLEIPFLIRKFMVSDRDRIVEMAGRRLSNIHFCPTYHIYPEAGNEPLSAITLFFDYDYGHKTVRSFFMYGTASEIGFVGRRTSNITFSDNIHTSSGRLDTVVQGMGFGTMLELVHADLLQREANERKANIDWIIKDRNYELLMIAEKAFKGNSSEQNRVEYEEAQAQHLRWEGIYSRFEGVVSKEGNIPVKVVTFKPVQEKAEPSLAMISEVSMRKNGKLGETVDMKIFGSEAEKEERNTLMWKNLMALFSQL